MFVQFWYRDNKDHPVKVTISDQSRKNEQEVGGYTVPPKEQDKSIFQEALILPRIVISEPQTIWIATYCDNQKVQDYPIEFLYK